MQEISVKFYIIFSRTKNINYALIEVTMMQDTSIKFYIVE